MDWLREERDIGKCYIIKNVINCQNEFKEPKRKYIVSELDLDKVHMKPTDYFEYDVYFRTDIIDSKVGIQKCIRLSQMFNLHNFHLVI